MIALMLGLKPVFIYKIVFQDTSIILKKIVECIRINVIHFKSTQWTGLDRLDRHTMFGGSNIPQTGIRPLILRYLGFRNGSLEFHKYEYDDKNRFYGPKGTV